MNQYHDAFLILMISILVTTAVVMTVRDFLNW